MIKITNLIFLFYFITIGIETKSQVIYPIFNPKDSSFTFSFSQSVEIAKTKKEKTLLQKEVEILGLMGDQNEKIIEKLMIKDSLSQKEIKYCENMNQLLTSKFENSTTIIDNYQKNLDEVESELKKTKYELKKEKFWKNIYKFGVPTLGTILLLII